MDAGEYVVYHKTKKEGSRSSPLLLQTVMPCLITERFRRGTAGQRAVLQHQRQVAHREVARANVADEHKSVGPLEVAPRNDVPLEPWCRCGQQGGVGRGSGNRRSRHRLRSRGVASVEEQIASSGL